MAASAPERRHAPDGYIEGACTLLGELGPATPGLGVTAARTLEATGRSRSSLYRHIESLPQLNEDLALHSVLAGDGWQRRLLRQPPERTFAGSLADALAGDADVGLWSRCSIPCLAPSGSARAGIVDWERQWLGHLRHWLDAHLAAHGRRWWDLDGRTAAVAVAALVEGHLLLDRIWTRPDDVGWHTGRIGDLPAKAERLLASITSPGTSEVASAPEAELPESPFRGTKRALLDELAGLLAAAAPGEDCIAAPTRLVAPHRLASHFGVTKRRIYDVWPTATDLNVDVATAIGRRFVAAAEECIDAMLIHGVEVEEMGPHMGVTTRAVAGFTQATVDALAGDWFQITTALHDRSVLEAHVAVTVGATDVMRRLYLAQLWVHRAKLRPEVPFDEYMGVMRAVIVGTQRLMTSQPAIATETVVHRGEPQPLAGLASNLTARSMVTRL